MTYQNQIKLTDLIAPCYYDLHWDIAGEKHTYYDLYGGRGSAKSSVISLEIVLGLTQDTRANVVVFRKYAVTLRDSVYEQIAWAIESLGLEDEWEAKVSPLSYVHKRTGQKILFRGLDKAKKTKSIKVSHGYIKYLWFEELDEFQGAEEIRTVQQSVLRGGDHFVVFKSFNPPISRTNWANTYVEEPREDSYRLHTDYTQIPASWLGRQFIDDARHLEKTNERAYKHEYLGIPVGLGTNVFEFLEIREITDEEVASFDRIYQGVDFGWYPDYYAFVRVAYDRARDKIYIIDEHCVNRQSNKLTAEWILEKGYDDYRVTCDSAEPKSINDYRDMGIPARGSIKGAGSVEYGFKWLQSRNIIIDPQRTPYAFKEYTEYEYERDRDGNVINGYPDANNHVLDATRYALESFYNKRGNSA